MNLTPFYVPCWILLLFNGFVISLGKEEIRPRTTVSPKAEFIASPMNVTVLEGNPAVLRCKLKDTVHNCQWYYLEIGFNMFDKHAKSVLVKEFPPTKERDCSIKFSKARLIQTGQWICKGIQIQDRKYVISDPAFLQVLQINEPNEQGTPNIQRKQNKEEDKDEEVTFRLSHEGHIINTKLGDPAVLGCHVNKELNMCSWIRPDGTTLSFEDGTKGAYVHKENYIDGNCSLKIQNVTERDEGNWRCVISVANLTGEKLGPLIHLHVLEFGTHVEGFNDFLEEKTKDPSLIIILVITSVVLFAIIVVLVCYMYKRVWRNSSSSHKYLESKTRDNEYSTYGSTWLQGIETKEQNLTTNDSTEMLSSENTKGNEYTRYLDMAGKGKSDGYALFPASSARSSLSSRTSISAVPASQNSMVDKDMSARTSTSKSIHSASNLETPTFDCEALQGRPLPQRQDSTYSQGHLYEEIDEIRMRNMVQDDCILPDYANTDEDAEGYMIPNTYNSQTSATMVGKSVDIKKIDPHLSEPLSEISKILTEIPPYCKLGENGLVPDPDTLNITSNPTYSTEVRPTEDLNEESYDIPNDPPVPLRTESLDNPLAEYDVPKKSSQENLPVFV